MTKNNITTINQLAKFYNTKVEKSTMGNTTMYVMNAVEGDFEITISKSKKKYSGVIYWNGENKRFLGTYTNQKSIVDEVLDFINSYEPESIYEFKAMHTYRDSDIFSAPTEVNISAKTLLYVDYIATQISKNRVILSSFASDNLTHRYIISYDDFKNMQEILRGEL